jgi:hypothetical protein
MRQGKKLILASIAVGAIALAGIAPAAASGASYTGTLPDGGTVSFKTVNRHAKIVRVKEFAWKNVPVTCTQGDFTYTALLPVSLRVTDRAFSIQALGTDLTQYVSGHFTNRGKRASGTLNVFGILGLGETGCSTGKLSWSAVRR